MSTTDSPSTVDAAKEQAAGVGQRAGAAAGDVATTAKEQAHEVVAEANAQVRNLGRQLKSEVDDQATTQRDRLVETLNAVSEELRQMADRSEQSGLATDAARQLAAGSRRAANYLEDHRPGDLVQGLTDLARRRPGAFLAAAAAAGLLAGRLTRGVVASQQDDTGSAGQADDFPAYDDRAYATPMTDGTAPYGGYPSTPGVAPAEPGTLYGGPGGPYAATPPMAPPGVEGPPPGALPGPDQAPSHQTYPAPPPPYETYPEPASPQQAYPEPASPQQAYPDTAEIERDQYGRDGRE